MVDDGCDVTLLRRKDKDTAMAVGTRAAPGTGAKVAGFTKVFTGFPLIYWIVNFIGMHVYQGMKRTKVFILYI